MPAIVSPLQSFQRELTAPCHEVALIAPEYGPDVETPDWLHHMIAAPEIYTGIISRNYTHNPDLSYRRTLQSSGVEEQELDFVIPVDVGVKKHAVMVAMRSSRYWQCTFGDYEVGDLRDLPETGYDATLMAGCGFDTRRRLTEKGMVPEESICDTPRELVDVLCGRFDYAPQPLRRPA